LSFENAFSMGLKSGRQEQQVGASGFDRESPPGRAGATLPVRNDS
jgi:hypothetical protein